MRGICPCQVLGNLLGSLFSDRNGPIAWAESLSGGRRDLCVEYGKVGGMTSPIRLFL